MKSIYVGCSLTNAPRRFTKKVEKLKERLRKMGYRVLEFKGLNRGTPKDVYHWDIHHCVASCDLFLAICDYPSIGLGYELEAAIERFGKRVLAVGNARMKVTRFVRGIDSPNLIYFQYGNFGQILKMVRRIMPPTTKKVPMALAA